ncbi:MAG: hypothetical protein HYT47_02365 [Candidatus Vogelbacteria bacterium]|nr:hypothetical protein [Candidatus Vogelbacteria bacterium]
MKNIMTTGTLVRKLNKEVSELKSDVREMKRFIFAPLKDPEGKYKKSFIKKVLARTQGAGPFYRFSNKESFLTHVRLQK